MISKLVYTICFFALSVNLFTQDLELKFDKILTELFPADEPGGTAIVAKAGQILYHKGFGKADLELDVDMKPEHIFRIGSITKQFTACAILRLAEEGKLSLDDDLTKYIEDYPTHGHSITIERLLTHTSGIRSYTGLEKWTSEERKRDFTPEEMMDYFKYEPMDFAPGEEYRYNNSAYFLLGYIIEKVSGKTYAEYISENFFKPLGMESSYYGSPAQIIKNRATGYQPEGEGYKNAEFLSMTQPYSAGSLLSNVMDLYKWNTAVMDYKVVGKESLQKAHKSFVLNNGQLTGYGYGWAIGNIQESPMIQHGGGINGYLTSSLYLPEEKVFVAVFSNCNCHAPQNASVELAALTIGKPFKWDKIELPEKELKSYTAVYESEYDGERIITFDNGQLYSMRTGGSRFEIYPYENDKFFFEESQTTLEFQRNKEGKIVSVVSKSTAMPMTWTRTDKEIPKKESIELPEAVLESYIGKYQLFEDFILTITKEGNQLFAEATGQEKVEIVPFEENKFFLKSVDAQLLFHKNEEGAVDSLTLIQNGQHKAKKIE